MHLELLVENTQIVLKLYIIELFEMTVGDFLTHIEILGLDEEEMSELMVSITDAFQEWVRQYSV